MINNIAIDITNHCNFDCIHCLRDKLSPRAHMQTELLEFALREVASVGIREVCLTGGEPALHPDLKQIFRLIKEYEMRFSLVSNAFLFEEKILPLIDSEVREYFSGVCFSLDGANAASHDMLRRESSFDKVIKSIDVCARENIPVSVKSIIHRKNINDITDAACLCASMGVGSLGFVFLTPTPRLISEKLMPSPQEYMDVTRYIKGRIIPSFSMVINIEGYADPDYKVSFCNPAQGISIDHEGNIIFCCNLSHPTAGDRPDTFGKEFLGNIKEIGIEEGIIRHYRTFAWFMEKTIDSNLKGHQTRNCLSCFKLFDKMDWIKSYESPYN